MGVLQYIENVETRSVCIPVYCRYGNLSQTCLIGSVQRLSIQSRQRGPVIETKYGHITLFAVSIPVV